MKFKLSKLPVGNPKDKHEKSSFLTDEIFIAELLLIRLCTLQPWGTF